MDQDYQSKVRAFLAAGEKACRIYAEAMTRVADELSEIQWPEMEAVKALGWELLDSPRHAEEDVADTA